MTAKNSDTLLENTSAKTTQYNLNLHRLTGLNACRTVARSNSFPSENDNMKKNSGEDITSQPTGTRPYYSGFPIKHLPISFLKSRWTLEKSGSVHQNVMKNTGNKFLTVLTRVKAASEIQWLLFVEKNSKIKCV